MYFGDKPAIILASALTEKCEEIPPTLKDGVSGFGGVSAPLKWPDMFKEIQVGDHLPQNSLSNLYLDHP